MSDYYHDDPIEEAPAGRFPSKLIASAVVVIASVFFFQGTLASNISINSGQNIEFGQSVAVTAACSGSENLTVTPKSSFDNAADGTGTYYLSSVSVSGIPSSCEGKDFNISFYDSATGSSALPIFTPPFESSKSVATVYNNAGYFQGGFQSTGTTVSGASGAFTVTFKTPVALSTNTMKVTLQSTEHKDWAQASITGGQGHTCTLLSSSILKCWGDNGYGQLGDGTTTQRRTPVAVSGLSSAVSAIASRNAHTCALLLTGAVQCWGQNTNGKLGDGTTTQRTTPVNVSGLSSGVIAISAADNHTCALLRTGGVKCWGEAGKTGDGTSTVRYTPVDVSGLTSGVSAISAAGYHTCALLSTGAVKCWGSDNNGTLGNAGGGNAPGGAITGFSADVIALASGIRHTCALLSTGGVQCWGTNDEGQLGNGTTSAGSSTPVNVSGLSSGVVAISAGNTTSCALLSTGVVKCWGRNVSGQLGNGSLISSSTPVTVSGLSAVAIGNGYYHACALLSSGAARCWGHNSSGQLGNNTTTDNSTPVSVTGIP
jgi:alpha-tubulin suppressor-like RCC1 family protein